MGGLYLIILTFVCLVNLKKKVMNRQKALGLELTQFAHESTNHQTTLF
jgi:hypothetical protein